MGSWIESPIQPFVGVFGCRCSGWAASGSYFFFYFYFLRASSLVIVPHTCQGRSDQVFALQVLASTLFSVTAPFERGES